MAGVYLKYIVSNETCLIDNKLNDSKNILLKKSDCYVGYKLNEHHWTTNYIYSCFLPELFRDLKIEFNNNDFVKIKSFSEDGNHDLSYHIPVNDTVVYFNDFTRNIKMNCKISELRVKNNEPLQVPLGAITNYHKLYRGAHACSEIINNNSKTKRTLILNSDSMSIPFIPILAYYYNKILYLDNRKIMDLRNVIKDYFNSNSDYVILMINDGGQERRIKRNLCLDYDK